MASLSVLDELPCGKLIACEKGVNPSFPSTQAFAAIPTLFSLPPSGPTIHVPLEKAPPVILSAIAMNHPSTKQIPDLEKSAGIADVSSASNSLDNTRIDAPPHLTGKAARWNAKIESLAGLEARGITRVLPEERQPASVLGYIQMTLLWFSANITANNLAVGLLGPLVFGLGFTDSAMCAVFGTVVGSAATAYMSIWGAQSGNRTMV